jgi:hypothetical protein
MKYLAIAIVLAACAASAPASAQRMNADDVKWINQCIDDSRGVEGYTPAKARAYCMCMNEKMDENETRSITQWEKVNPGARRDCERKSGWQ